MRAFRLSLVAALLVTASASVSLAGHGSRRCADPGTCEPGCTQGHIHSFCNNWISGRRLVRFWNHKHHALPVLTGPAGGWDDSVTYSFETTTTPQPLPVTVNPNGQITLPPTP